RAFVFLVMPRPPSPTLFPYTTLFRSVHAAFHFAHTFRLDVGVATGGRGVQAANTVDRGPLERTGVEVYEPGGREHVLRGVQRWLDRKSTRLNSSHLGISYAVFCLKKK